MANYLSDFNVADGAVPAGQLTFLSGSGTISSNRLSMTAGSPVKLAVRPETLTRDNYVVHGIVRAGAAASSAQRGGVAFCVQDTANYYYLTFKPGAFGNVYLYRIKAFTTTLLVTHPSGSNINLPVDTDMKLEARVSGIGSSTNTIEVYLDDALLFSFDDSADPLTSPGRAGFYLGDAAGDSYLFDDLTIVEGQATPVVSIDQTTQSIMVDKDETVLPYNLTATATDEEDGDLSASIQWTLSTDGGPSSNIGTGASISHDLPIGVNVITAEATDTFPSTGTDSITITVLAYDFGGITPVVGGFIDGDTYTGNGVRVLITQQPSFGKIFITEEGGFVYYPDNNTVTTDTFKYRIQDQEGISNEATITLNFSV